MRNIPGDVENTASQGQDSTLEDMDKMHSIALLQNAALNKVKSAVETDERRTEDIVREIEEADKNKDYSAQRVLIEVLRQRLDIADINGTERPKAILDALAKVYAADEYSEARQKVMVEEMPTDNPDVIAHTLLDNRFSKSLQLLSSIKDIQVRESVYQVLKSKNAASLAVTLVSTTRDNSLKTKLFEDLASWLKNSSNEEAKKVKSPSGRFFDLKSDVAVLLLRTDSETFNRLLENEVIDIDGLERNIGGEPDERLLDILMHVKTADDASRVFKFMSSKETILSAIPKLDSAALPPELRTKVVENMQRLVAAFDNKPQIHSLGRLRPRDKSMASYNIANKFIIGLREGEDSATIAWSNTEDFWEHKQLSERVGNIPKALCAGGQVELVQPESGCLQVVFKGFSATYGSYNKSFLEGFKQAIAERLKLELGTEVEVVVEASKY